MIAGLLFAVALGMALVRLGWGGRRGAAAAGWAWVAAALFALTWRDGAWGLAVGGVAAITTAMAFVLLAGWRSPARARRAPREAPSVSIPRRPRDFVRRLAVFALVVPVAFAAAEWLAFGAQALARTHGAGDADATALMLFLQPIAWAAVAAAQMTRANAARMASPPAVAALAGAIFWALS